MATPVIPPLPAGFQLDQAHPQLPPGFVLDGEMAPEHKSSFVDEVKGGLASAPINMYLGAKQMFGGLSPVELDVLKQNKEASAKAPVSSFLSNVGATAPAMLIPGVNTMAGSALLGGGMGLVEPAEGEQSFANIAKQKLLSGVVGSGAGAVGQYAGSKAGKYLQEKTGNALAEKAAEASRNSVKDASIKEGMDAGYTVPRSLYNPSFFTNRMESLGGKAAVKQQAASENQQVTNELARKALNIPNDQPLTKGYLDQLKDAASAPYKEVAALPKLSEVKANTLANIPAKEAVNPAKTLEELKQARNDATGWFEAYNRSKSPEDLSKAKGFRALSEKLEGNLEDYARANGKPDLVDRLVAARKEIAKIYDVRRSLNDATGDVSANVFGRLFEKGKPLTGELKTIGQFRTAMPQITQDGAKIPAAGISKSEAIVSALLGIGGAGLTGNPIGGALALAPLASHPARALTLSKALQKSPEYSVGNMTKLGSKMDPETAAAVAKLLAAGSLMQNSATQ